MGKNSFYCPNCNERTVHFELDADELTAMQGGNTILQINNRICQFIGMYDVIKFVTGRKCWKCSKCGLGTTRRPDGSIYEHYKDGKRWG